VVPVGTDWLHEIKYDGYRLLVRKDGNAVSIINRGGYDWTERYPLIVEGALRLRHCLLLGLKISWSRSCYFFRIGILRHRGAGFCVSHI